MKFFHRLVNWCRCSNFIGNIDVYGVVLTKGSYKDPIDWQPKVEGLEFAGMKRVNGLRVYLMRMKFSQFLNL